MQRMGDVPHHVVAHDAGEREDGKVAEELFWRDVSQPAEQNNHQRHDRVFAPWRSGFGGFFWLRRRFRCRLRLSRNLNRRRRPGNFTFTDHRDAAHHHIVEINGDVAVFLFAKQLQQVDEVGAVELRRLRWQAARQIGIADHLHAVSGRGYLIWNGIFTVTAVLGGQVDNHAARLHGVNHLTGDQLRRRFTRDKRGGDNNVDIFRLGGEEFHFGFDKGFGHHLRVTIAAACFFLEVQLKEFGAHTLDLFFYFRTGIKGAYDSAQAVCRTDCGKARHACANHHHFRRRDFTRGGDLTGKEATKLVGRFNNGAVAGNVCHGA